MTGRRRKERGSLSHLENEDVEYKSLGDGIGIDYNGGLVDV
jgi:hypothetical protein